MAVISVKITLTSAGINSGPFDIYIDDPSIIIDSNVPRSVLMSGTYQKVVPDSAKNVIVKSNGLCIGKEIIIPITNLII